MLKDDLRKPINLPGSASVQDFLTKLQGNILKGHGRNHTVNLFCHFRADAKAEARQFIAAQVHRMKSARHQLDAASERRGSGKLDTDPFVCIFLSKAGYDYFGVAEADQPRGKAFCAGMGATAALNDPPRANWTASLRDPHVLILVALMSASEAEKEATSLLNQIGEIGDVQHHTSGDIIGGQYFNTEGNGIENFGYVDGRSQPLVLQDDVDRETAAVAKDQNATGIKTSWPAKPFPVDQFVVRDPAVADEAAYGSYFVFRQLEQNVAGFKSAEDAVNTRRSDPTFATNADSIVVGRLENGTPIERSFGARLTDNVGHTLPVSNAFMFTTNPPNCPYFSHIRKVNPRTDDTQARLMIRRGITYGFRPDRTVDQQGRFVLPDEAQLPHKDVGLLFQSYQASIEEQFEFAQTVWANTGVRSDKPDEMVGIDPVIGQPGPGKDQVGHARVEWPRAPGHDGTAADMLDFYTVGSAGKGPYVKLMGGGYFFAPSLPGLASMFVN